MCNKSMEMFGIYLTTVRLSNLPSPFRKLDGGVPRHVAGRERINAVAISQGTATFCAVPIHWINFITVHVRRPCSAPKISQSVII